MGQGPAVPSQAPRRGTGDAARETMVVDPASCICRRNARPSISATRGIDNEMRRIPARGRVERTPRGKHLPLFEPRWPERARTRCEVGAEAGGGGEVEVRRTGLRKALELSIGWLRFTQAEIQLRRIVGDVAESPGPSWLLKNKDNDYSNMN